MIEYEVRQQWEARRRQRTLSYERRLKQLYDTVPGLRELDAAYRGVYTGALMDMFTRGAEQAGTLAGITARRRQLKEKLDALLQAHGLSPDLLEDTPLCPLCRDYGYVGADMCACLRAELEAVRKKKLSRTLPLHSFEEFDPRVFSSQVDAEHGFSQRENMKKIKRRCQRWAQNFGADSPNLFLAGGVGQGKTFLCSCMAGEVLTQGASVVYDTAIHMLSSLEDKKFDRGGEDPRPYFDCDLLIIDDLGTEMNTSFVQSALYDVINTRLITGRTMMINTNLNTKDISGRYLPQTASRIKGEFEQVLFFGPDIRLRKPGFYL